MPPIMRKINIISRCQGIFRANNLQNDELTPCHHSYILAITHNPGITQDELAKNICVNKSNVTRTLVYLEKNGYVERKPSPSDKRAIQVFPTQKMQEIFPKIKQIVIDWNTYLTKDLSDEEMENFQSVLEKISERAKNYIENKGGDKL